MVDKGLCVAQDSGMAQTPSLLGTKDACQRIGIDRSTLSRWIKDGTAVPAMRVSDTATGAYLFSEDEVDRLRALADQRLRRAS